MFTKLRKDKKNTFSVLDIETGKEGNVLEIGLDNGKDYYKFNSWAHLMAFLHLHNSKKCFRKIIIHNGGRFDLVSLLMDESSGIGEWDLIPTGSSIVFLKCKSFKKQIIFQDSFQLLKSSLKKCCHDYKVETPKRDIDIDRIEEIFHNDYEQFDKYLRADCKGLYQVLEAFQKIMDIDFVPVTTASLAMYLFRRKFLEKDFMLPSLRMNNRTDRFITRAYAGGRVECFRPGIYEQAYSYDINSLYPSVMINNLYPIGRPVFTTKWNAKHLGFYDITWNQKDRSIPPVLWIKSKNGFECVYEGRWTIPSPEIKLALKHGVEIEFHSGLFFPKSMNLFKNWVTHWYETRLEAKDDGNNALAECCKLMMNRLYGKFAQKEEAEKVCKIEDKETLIKLLKKKCLKPYQEENFLYTVTEQRMIPHRAVHIAAMVTSYARVVLAESLISHINTLIYCDTDSVHLTAPMNEDFISDQLGYFKAEEEGKAVYLGRKAYMIGDKQKFKGIRLKGGLKHDNLDFDGYCSLCSGGVISFAFDTFPTIKSCWKKGLTPCKLTTLAKNIKKPDYTSNFACKTIQKGVT